MSNNKNLPLIIGIIVVFILGILIFSFFNFFSSSLKKGKVSVNSQTFNVQVAEKSADLQKGLSKKTSLKEDEGMLFVFPKDDYYAFWMKDMKMPIDIIFIKDTNIVTIYENVPFPASAEENLNPPTYVPTAPVNRVLELKAGSVQKYSIKTGDTVTIEL